MAIEQFFSVPKELLHGATVNTGFFFRGHVTLTPAAEPLAVELSLPDLMTLVVCIYRYILLKTS